MNPCEGTIDWHCLLAAGHKGPCAPGPLKGADGPPPLYGVEEKR